MYNTSTIDIINRFRVTHGDLYDYSKVSYTNNSSKVLIICKKHGEVLVNPHQHWKGSGCPKCFKESRKTSQEVAIKKLIEVHGKEYDYSNSRYISLEKPINIGCKVHGEVNINYYSHLKGSGCPKCTESTGESIVRKYLVENNIIFEKEKSFEGCSYKKPLRFDFYLPESGTCIEVDGEQHHRIFDYFGGQVGFEEIQKRDSIKNEFCKRHGIKLIRIEARSVSRKMLKNIVKRNK